MAVVEMALLLSQLVFGPGTEGFKAQSGLATVDARATTESDTWRLLREQILARLMLVPDVSAEARETLETSWSSRRTLLRVLRHARLGHL